MELFRQGALASACATLLMLTACGGGGTDNTGATSSSSQAPQPADAGAARASAAGLVPVTAGDTILTVYQPDPANAFLIGFKDSQGNVITVKKNATDAVTTLDDIPAAIAFHTWVTSTTAPAGHLRLRFTPGTYRFSTSQGWAWPVQASGRGEDRQIVLEQVPGTDGEVALLGSVPATATYQAGAPSASVTIPANVGAFDQVWAEGRRAIRARHPNAGEFFYIKGETYAWPDANGVVVSSLPVNGVDTEVSRMAFQADDEGYQWLAHMKQTAASNPDAVLVHMDQWTASRHGIEAVDNLGKRVRVKRPLPKDWAFARSTGRRYFVENVDVALDAPGEWYWHAGTGELKYIPVDNTQSKTIQFEIPRVNKLLSMQGNVNGGKWLEYVQFSRLKFRYAKDNHQDRTGAGYFVGQADHTVPAAIELNDARHISFVQCEVSHTGGYGVWFNRRVRSSRFAASDLYDLGAGGIKVAISGESHQDTANGSPSATGDNTILQNRIFGIGHDYPGALGVGIGQSSGNKVIGNLIADTTYTGISVGWSWTLLPSSAHDNQIRNNFLHNIGQNALSDLAGIYTLGRSPGTEITGNVIKGVKPYAYKGHGIYADEGSTNLLVNGNIVVGAGGAGFFQHWGGDNTVVGNAFADVDYGFGIYNRPPANNTDKVPPGTDVVNMLPATLRDNFFFPRVAGTSMVAPTGTTGPGTLVSNTQPPAWLAAAPVFSGNKVSGQFMPDGHTQALSPLCTDCVFSDASNIDVGDAFEVPYLDGLTLNPHGIAHDWRMLQPSAQWSAKSRWASDIALEPLWEFDFRASQWPLGVPTAAGLPVWNVLSSKQPTTPAPHDPYVQFEQDAQGRTFMALNDAPRPAGFEYEPYLDHAQTYTSGHVASEFALRFNATSHLWHQFRDDRSGGSAGPTIYFVAQGGSSTLVDVKVNGVVVARVPIDERHTFRMFSPIAPAPATWWLKITCQNGNTAEIKGLPQSKPGWQRMGWVVFVSQANVQTKTAIYSAKLRQYDDFEAPSASATPYSAGMTGAAVCQ